MQNIVFEDCMATKACARHERRRQNCLLWQSSHSASRVHTQARLGCEQA